MIRYATHFDIPSLVELGALMHGESRFRVLPFNPDKLATLPGSLIAGDHGFVSVSEKNGEVVGGFVGIATPHWASDAVVATDLALFMSPEHRGGTSAARLIRAFVRWAQERGALMTTCGISTGVHEEQTAALYARLGGSRYGSLWEFGNVHGR